MSLATGCFSDPPPVSNGGTSSEATGTEGNSAESTTSTSTEGEAESERSGSGGTSGGTGSTGTDGFGTQGSGIDPDTEGETENTGADTGNVEDCAATVYLNFDGVTLTAGGVDNSAQNVSAIGFEELTQGPLMPFAGPTDPIVAAVSDHLSPFNVCLVTTRPASGDYEMVVITSSEPPLKFVTALSATADCGNSNMREISFVFGLDAADLATAISSRVGFHIGLENATNPADIMGPPGAPGPEFIDVCSELNNPPTCVAQHATHCDAGEQNSFRELLGAFGPANP